MLNYFVETFDEFVKINKEELEKLDVNPLDLWGDEMMKHKDEYTEYKDEEIRYLNSV